MEPSDRHGCPVGGGQWGASWRLMSSSTGTGPGSRPSWAARCSGHEVAEHHEVEQLGQRPSPSATTSSMPATTSSRTVVDAGRSGGAICGCSNSWRRLTTRKTWRVTSPFWPQPQISLWHSSGMLVGEGRTLAFSLNCVFHRRGGHRADAAAAVDDRHRGGRSGGPARVGRVVVGRQLVAPAAQLLDRRGDPRRRAGEQADALEQHQRRHRHRAECRPAASGCRRRPAPRGAAHCVGQPAELAAAGDRHQPRRRRRPPRWRASTVSSVSPENDTANTSVCSSTKFGQAVALVHDHRHRP